jgi:hypothetical protein
MSAALLRNDHGNARVEASISASGAISCSGGRNLRRRRRRLVPVRWRARVVHLLIRRSGERIAAPQVARLKSAAEPFHPLLSGAVSECVDVHALSGLLLDAIIANRGRRRHCLIDITRREDISLLS